MSEPERISYSDVLVRCGGNLPYTTTVCGHEFIMKLPQHVRMEVHSAALKAARCPKCGGGPKRLFLIQSGEAS